MTQNAPTFSEIEQVKGLIEQLDSYIQHYHGGAVEFVDYDGKVVRVRLGGACIDCPLSDNTLHGWVEGTLRQFFPNITGVEQVTDG